MTAKSNPTESKAVWSYIDGRYRQELAMISIKEMSDKGIVSVPRYSEMKGSSQMPAYDFGCYLSLTLFGIFIRRDPKMDSPRQKMYRKKRSWDILLELSGAYAVDFMVRGKGAYPIDPTVPILRSQKNDPDSKGFGFRRSISEELVSHDNVGGIYNGAAILKKKFGID